MEFTDKLKSVYFHCPVFLQNILCSIKGYQHYKQRFGKEFRQIYENLLETDRYDAVQIRKYKELHISKILHYAYNHCVFYRRKYDAAGISPDDFKVLEDLRKFPVLTKEEIRGHLAEMLSDEYGVKDLIPYHTSGSTGKALDFYWTKESLQYFWAVATRGRQRVGIHLKDRQLDFTGKLVAPLSQKKPPYWRYNKALNQYLINQQHITADKAAAIAGFLNKAHIAFFTGYPSIVYTLAMHINEQGLTITDPPRFFFSGAEKVYEFQKAAIEKAFPGMRILETYSFSEEAGSIRCCKCGKYHEDFELGHFEIADVSSKTGKLLVTGFRNFGMPFIRYEVGDTATVSDEDCACGMQSSIFMEIDGRNEDYIITPEGQRLTRLGYLFNGTTHFFEAQIIQKELYSIVVRAVPRKDACITDIKADEELVRTEIRKNFSPALKVCFEYVDRIPRTASGKFKFVDSKLASAGNAVFSRKRPAGKE